MPRSKTHIQAAFLLPAFLALVVAARDAQAIVYYDLDFSSPPHQVGLPPATGAGPAPRATVSAIAHGNPVVVAGEGALGDQPLLFDAFDLDGDQIHLDLDDLEPSSFYCLETLVLVTAADPAAELSFLFDTPEVRSVSFLGDGTVRVFVPSEPPTIANYVIGQVLALHVDVDLDADTWSVWIDGTLIHSGTFGGAGQLDAVRVSTDVFASPPGMRAAIDNFLLGPTCEAIGPCDWVGFGDLTLGASYPSGSSFEVEGITVNVSSFHYNVGACTGDTTSGAATVENGHLACGVGKEIEVNNVTLDFDFGGTVTDVVILYGEYGGTVSLGVNGDCQVVDGFMDLDGSTLGGVAVRVFEVGPAGGCGVIRFGGAIDDLTIGGQELWIDDLSYCRECADLVRSAYEDQVVGTTYTVGQSFVSGAASYDVLQFYPPGPTCTAPNFAGFVEIRNDGLACGGGKELLFNNANVRIDFGATLDWILVSFGEYGGNVNLRINGDCRNVENFSDLNGQTVGGVFVWAADLGDPGQSCGTLYAVGAVDEFGLGGQELTIDNVRACPAVAASVGEAAPSPGRALVRLEQNRPNPFLPATTIGFELERGGRARLTIYDVAGRAVRALVDREMAAGRHEFRWDGRDARGARVPSGVYAYRLEMDGGGVRTRRMIVLE